MKRMWVALLLAFLPGSALMLVYVWTMIPSDWFTMLYGNGAGGSRGTIAAQILTPYPTPRATPDLPTAPPVAAQPRQQQWTAVPKDIPQRGRSAHVREQRGGKAHVPALGSPRLTEGGDGIGHAPPRQPLNMPGTVAAYQRVWVHQSARHPLFLQLGDAGNTRAGHRCAGPNPDRRADGHDVRAAHPSFPVNAGRIRGQRGWDQDWQDRQPLDHVVA
jgi:hypothetical protein